MKYFRKNILFALVASLVFSYAFFASSAHAALFSIDFIQDTAINFLVSRIFYIVGYIAATTFSFGGFLIELALELNSRVMELPAVLTGWRIALNITNLGFVLGIIVIAIGTILRNQTYGMKKLLFNFVVAAVMVNFSLVIAGLFLDFSGVLTQFFVSKVSPAASHGEFSGFAQQLAAGFNPQGFAEVKSAEDMFAQDQAEIQARTEGTPLSTIANLSMLATFTIVGAVVFLGIAAMLIIRFVMLAILLIIAPIVWLGYVFPEFKGYWGMWWEKFLKWIFFAPACTFFLYLAIYTAANKGGFVKGIVANMSTDNAGVTATIKNLVFADIGNIAESLIVIALMLGSILVAEKLGIYGAGATMGAAQAGGKAFLAWSGKSAARASGALGARTANIANRMTGGAGKNLFEGAAARLRSIQTTIAKTPVVGGIPGFIGKETRNLSDSVLGGIKSGSGLFKKGKTKEEEKETTAQDLDRILRRRDALRGDIALLQQNPQSGVAGTPEHAQLTEAQDKLAKLDKKKDELELKLS